MPPTRAQATRAAPVVAAVVADPSAQAKPAIAGRVLAPPVVAAAPPLPLPEGLQPLPLPLSMPETPPEGLADSGPAERRVWTADEDVQIAALVAEHGTRSWSIIAALLPTRTGKQCRERWHNHLVRAARGRRGGATRRAGLCAHAPGTRGRAPHARSGRLAHLAPLPLPRPTAPNGHFFVRMREA